MAEESGPLAGPDFSAGVAATSIAEGATLLGHTNGEAVLLARCGGKLYAVGAVCTHYSGPLGDGLVVGETVRCPWHHAVFNLRTGRALHAPAMNDLPRWRVREENGRAFVSEKRETPLSVVIVGAGAAGALAAETLRNEGYDGAITMIEAGPAGPYDRPNLSKDYLAGTASEEWIPLRPESYYTDRRITLKLNTRVASIDVKAKRVTLDDASTLDFGALLLATGADPIVLPYPGAQQPVHYLRTLSDSKRIIAAAANAKHAVVMGASFIGLEVAASLRARNIAVTVVAPESRPLERILGAEVGDFVRALHEKNGVVFKLEQTVNTVGANSVTLKNGETIVADLVVAGIGVRPAIALATDAGLATEKGVSVNEFLETSAPDIFAAGDIARWPDVHSGTNIRVEHWVVAERQGKTAARNMLGLLEPFDAVPFFWTHQYNVAINYVGHAEKWDRITIDGDIPAGNFEASYILNGKTIAVATVGRDMKSLQAECSMQSNTPALIL
jgi:NADPH-dependent 2,4-dienoyl-CoA reductase/sulfur reductase-like enzyme/nitrite reductase/ring-hydroxylating ferredoxin subunit